MRVSTARIAGGVLGLLVLTTATLHADDWSQWLGSKRDGVWREDGILKRFPAGGPKKQWSTPIGGGYAGAAVVDGKVFIQDRQLDPGQKESSNPFDRKAVKGSERLLCLDAKSGKELWKYTYPSTYEISYPCGPRCTPIVAEGKVWGLGAMGDLFCVDAKTGEKVWHVNLPEAYQAPVPLWGFSASPLLDGDRLICLVGGPQGVAVAFDKNTGKEKWKSLKLAALKSEIGYAPPILVEAGGKRQLIIWHPEALNGLDPETGKVYWSEPFVAKNNLSVATPALAGDLLFVTSFYNGSMCVRLDKSEPKASLVWKSKARGESPDQTLDLNSIMPTPYLRDGHVYGICSYGELRCLELATGKRIWQDLHATTGDVKEPTTRWANAFLTPQGDRWFLFNEKGELIIAKLTPKGYEEIDRAKLIEPTGQAQLRKVVWSHPAYANKCVFVRNDKEIACFSLAE
jgi:outer membrane protein assembly factor BamB